MSFEHLDIAAELELAPAPKLVLVALSKCACRACGLAWPGIAWILRKSGLKETSARAALDALRGSGLIVVHAYPTGGRGRATEYVVLPGLMELSTAPCGECRERMKTPRHAKGIAEYPSPREGFEAKPLAEVPLNPSRGDPQSVRESESVSARAREAVPSPPAPAAATPPVSIPPDPSDPGHAALQGILSNLDSQPQSEPVRRPRPNLARPDPR